MLATSRTWKIARGLFGLLGAAFLVVAFVRTSHVVDAELYPGTPRFLLSALLWLMALICSARAWTILCGGGKLEHAPGFLKAQLGKYIPGGIWQFAGQVAYAHEAGVPLPRATVAVPAHLAVQVVAGGVVTILFAVIAGGKVLWLLLPGFFCLLPAHRRLLRKGLQVFLRRMERGPSSTLERSLPSQKTLFESAAWSFLTLVLGGAGFLVLLPGTPALSLHLLAAWGFAWTVGYLAFFFPSGLGAREGILLLLFAGDLGASVIAASVLQRLAALLSEGILIAGILLQAGRVFRLRGP